MKFDLALVLVIGSALTGSIWFCHRMFVGRGQVLAANVAGPGAREPRIVEYSRVLFPVAFAVLVIRSFLLEPYKIPTPSMVPTLHVGDFIFVSKFSYGLRLPLVNARILDTGQPERGDVVVFRLPTDPSVNYIKRVVGLPNDRIVYRDHRLFINGEEIDVQLSSELYTADGARNAVLGFEVLDDKPHPILHMANKHDRAVRHFEQTVPPGHYFMMGDNRDNSQDSRSATVGFVPEENLVGKAVYIWLNVQDFSRVGDRIH